MDTRLNGNELNISFELPDQVISLIKATPFSLNQNSDDSLTWAFSKDGFFSLKAAYLLARGSNPLNLDTPSMAWIWKTETHPQVQFFIWMCLHNNLPTGEVLGSKGLNLNLICIVCHLDNESVDHLLRGCNIAQELWQRLKIPQGLLYSFDQPIENWMETNCNSKVISNHLGIRWKIVLPMGLWHLWLTRNNFLFRSGVVDRMIHTKCIRDSAEFFSIGAKIRCNRMKKMIQVAWEKPPTGWIKLNSDGSALGNPGKAGGGVLIRDHQGNWVRGYARSLDNTSNSIAELWALRDGLDIAKELGIDNLIVEMDALSIVMLMSNNSTNLLMEPLLDAIPYKRLVHTFNEANQCADKIWGELHF